MACPVWASYSAAKRSVILWYALRVTAKETRVSVTRGSFFGGSLSSLPGACMASIESAWGSGAVCPLLFVREAMSCQARCAGFLVSCPTICWDSQVTWMEAPFGPLPPGPPPPPPVSFTPSTGLPYQCHAVCCTQASSMLLQRSSLHHVVAALLSR